MHVAAPDRDELRRLAELRLDRPVLLSLYLNLDPSEFATAPARATGIRSLLDDADRSIRERDDGLEHEDRQALRRSLARARSYLEGETFSGGAQGVAVFSCEPADLLQGVMLPRPVTNRVSIGRSPLVGPLARQARRERWCIALVNRRDARVFRGSPDGLREVGQIHDEVYGQHHRGGWAQARLERGIEKEKDDHLRHTADVLMDHFKRSPFERLAIGGPREVVADFEPKLHHYLRDRVAGRVQVDVDASTAEQILERTRPCFEELEAHREVEAVARVEAESRAAAGLEPTLEALNERRTEMLLLDRTFSTPGGQCPRCGWLGGEGTEACPADGAALVHCDDLADAMIELAIQQSAEVLPLRHAEDALEARGGVAALLRF
jgi:peptide chain release factor subunit 1